MTIPGNKNLSHEFNITYAGLVFNPSCGVNSTWLKEVGLCISPFPCNLTVPENITFPGTVANATGSGSGAGAGTGTGDNATGSGAGSGSGQGTVNVGGQTATGDG